MQDSRQLSTNRTPSPPDLRLLRSIILVVLHYISQMVLKCLCIGLLDMLQNLDDY